MFISQRRIPPDLQQATDVLDFIPGNPGNPEKCPGMLLFSNIMI